MTEKRTRQRAAIQSVLKEEGRPLTVDEIHRLARREIPRLGVSTVYRCVRRMLDDRQLVGVDFPGHSTRYELPTQDVHSHFVCTSCDKVYDLPDSPEIPPVSLPEGFRAKGYELIVYGLCPRCEKKSE